MTNKLFSIKTLAIIALIATSLFVAYTLISKKEAAADQAAAASNLPKKAALSVEAVMPSNVTWPMGLQVNGEVYPWQEAIVSSEIGGLRISKVHVDVGQQVKKGQLLVTLANETVAAALRKQEAVVARDAAQLAEAQTNATRANTVKASGALSMQKINQYMIAEKTAQANLALSNAELINQQIRMRQTKILAPDSGMITSRTANLGQVVSAGTVLFKCLRQNRIEWRAEVNTNQLKHIKKGQKITIKHGDGEPIIGTVRMISPNVDANSRNAIVYIDLPKQSAKPGMYLTGEINLGNQSALTVPQSAVILRDGISYLFELVKNKQHVQVVQRKVKTGRTRNAEVEILEGANANTNYVLTGAAFLNDGDIVNVVGGAQ